MTDSTPPPFSPEAETMFASRGAVERSREARRSEPPLSRRGPLKPDARPLRQILPPTTGPWPALSALLELERVMKERIAEEEGPAGLFDFLCRAAPRYLSLIEHLRVEHERILRDIQVLHLRARHCEDVHQAERELNALIDAIDDHEAFEREILRDAIER